jgi:hypothetical protein
MTLGQIVEAVGWALRGLAVALGAVALAGCSTLVQTRVITPPPDLLLDCPEPDRRIVTNEDLTNGYLDMRGALRACNADKAALRTWAVEAERDNPDD